MLSAHSIAVALLAGLASVACTAREAGGPPQRLADTGLYADPATREIAPGVFPFTPQYPLWSDGAAKERWFRLPEGSAIDASAPDRWRFPVGTKFWKEFRSGRRIETRYMELRADQTWTYASYVWNADQSDAILAPERGLPRTCTDRAGIAFDIPSQTDCRACHEGHPSRVLGFSALQLSPDRDPLAPHADAKAANDLDLADLVARGLVRGLPAQFLATPPRIAAATPRGRAALGYLHGNCASCHNRSGPLAALGMSLEQTLADAGADPVATSAIGCASGLQLQGASERIAAGAPERSVVHRRMASRNPLLQMPPLGTQAPDRVALDLLAAWIREDLGPVARPANASDLHNRTHQKP